MVKLPAGYTLLVRERVRAAVRRDLAETLGPWLLGDQLAVPPTAEPVRGGRGAAYRAVLPGGVRAVVRPYRRGGLLARFVRQTYVGLRSRPLVELAVTAEVRGRGVPAAEVLAARVEGGPFAYRGALVTAEIRGALPLLHALESVDDGSRVRLAEEAGAAVGALHAAGVFHADLNLDNILVPGDGAQGGATLVDFDRARIRRAPLAARGRRRNLMRLARSARKLDPSGRWTSGEALAAFCAGYARTAGVPCAC
ncbi:MAG: lipopolysaccharide kinase InaA family protein [Candidatus Binatia bacterium]